MVNPAHAGFLRVNISLVKTEFMVKVCKFGPVNSISVLIIVFDNSVIGFGIGNFFRFGKNQIYRYK